MTTKPPELARAKRAAADVRASRTEYREALVAAHEAGVPVATIARAVGVSRQAVYALLERANLTQSERGKQL